MNTNYGRAFFLGGGIGAVTSLSDPAIVAASTAIVWAFIAAAVVMAVSLLRAATRAERFEMPPLPRRTAVADETPPPAA